MDRLKEEKRRESIDNVFNQFFETTYDSVPWSEVHALRRILLSHDKERDEEMQVRMCNDILPHPLFSAMVKYVKNRIEQLTPRRMVKRQMAVYRIHMTFNIFGSREFVDISKIGVDFRITEHEWLSSADTDFIERLLEENCRKCFSRAFKSRVVLSGLNEISVLREYWAE